MLFEDYAAIRGQQLMHFAQALTGDQQLAQDLVQTTFVDVFKNWSRVAAAEHPDAYVRKILLNTYLGWRRRRWFTERPAYSTYALRQTSPDPADHIVVQDEMRSAVRSLPARARTVLVLRYYEDLDDHEIAEALGVSVSNVRATASRALAALRKNAVTNTKPSATTNPPTMNTGAPDVRH